MSAASVLLALIITNVTLVDGTGRPPVPGVTRVIEGDRFRSVSSNDEAPPSTGARILDADPTEDIDNVKKIHAVIKAGAVIDRSALEIPANGATEP